LFASRLQSSCQGAELLAGFFQSLLCQALFRNIGNSTNEAHRFAGSVVNDVAAIQHNGIGVVLASETVFACPRASATLRDSPDRFHHPALVLWMHTLEPPVKF